MELPKLQQVDDQILGCEQLFPVLITAVHCVDFIQELSFVLCDEIACQGVPLAQFIGKGIGITAEQLHLYDPHADKFLIFSEDERNVDAIDGGPSKYAFNTCNVDPLLQSFQGLFRELFRRLTTAH